MSLPTIWVVGDWQEPVFADAIAWLNSHATCRCFDSPMAAVEKQSPADDFASPRSIVLVQSRPGQFSAHDIERLHAQRPLARLIALTGPWCEGELRSGRPWPGVVRVPWRSWQNLLQSELEIGNGTTSLLPRSATETDRVERLASATRLARPLHGSVAIYAHNMANYAYLADAAGQLGLAVASHAGPDSAAPTPDVMIFDGWETASAISQFGPSTNSKPGPNRILLLHFPRPEDHTLARESGFDAVLAHPLSLADLGAALSRSIKRAAQGPTRPTPN